MKEQGGREMTKVNEKKVIASFKDIGDPAIWKCS